ncbi:uncharacterized protein LOC144139052 [Haemaphysalis longicornis]
MSRYAPFGCSASVSDHRTSGKRCLFAGNLSLRTTTSAAHRWCNKWGSQQGQYCGLKRHRLSILRVQRGMPPYKLRKLLQLHQATAQLESCNWPGCVSAAVAL